MLDSCSCLALFTWYAEQCKAFKLLNVEMRRVVVSKDVMLYDTVEWSASLTISESTGNNDSSTYRSSEASTWIAQCLRMKMK